MSALFRGIASLIGYALASWASWYLVGTTLWNGSDLSQIATPAAMIAVAFVIGRSVELGVGLAMSRARGGRDA